MTHPIHIITRFSGIGGCETHAVTLAQMLAPMNPVTVWADSPGSEADKFGAIPISPFSGRMPRGGTLIFLGTHFQAGIWLDYAKPKRIIVICVLSNPAQVFAALTVLERPSLPVVELVFVSSRLQDTLGLPGIVGPEPMDLRRFHPTVHAQTAPFTIGRHSRDVPEKHHRDDPSLYRMLDWSGVRIHLMGATCLSEALCETEGIKVSPAGSIAAEAFLGELCCFFYRTDPRWAEPSGRVVMEALASGVPVVVHDSGGYTDWIEQGKNGYIFSSQEEAFDLLMALKSNPVQRRQMASAARASAENLVGGERMARYLRWLNA
ncbi:glycosyltransferase [Propionivibrio sp.]|uniref:glycosyltransferase n=1 Tax=Propionivibrio sp. TaxID=2212460 RepID=UPI0025F2B796|nr:glycosyltransferase [Propionivibrio sp.]MBK8743842.1 glycosyltransferase [Propionivibrio sp.]